MRTMAFSTILSLCLLNAGRAEEPVHFVDLVLKTAVEDHLWITDPTPTDMLGLTSLRAEGGGVGSLVGLQYATNLETLELACNKIRDVALLADLGRLRRLVLNNNQISDLSPLSGLLNLEYLDIHENIISDVSGLAGLANLRYLNIHDNQIRDISAFSGLVNLETLIIGESQLSDISALSGLLHLCALDLERNRIGDISPLASLNSLADLNLSYNEITDISPLVALTSLQSLNLHGNPRSETACDIYIPQILANNPGVLILDDCGPFTVSVSCGIGGSILDPGEGLFTYAYGESVQLEARPDPYFLFAGWSGTVWSLQNPDAFLATQNLRIHADFVSVLDVIHVDDDAPGDPRPGDFTASDPSENGTGEHPFDRIQEAIEVAREGATIVVHAGTYRETIDLLGKSLTLTGFDPADPNSGGAWPVLDGNGAGPVVSFTRGEDVNCTLAGFVIVAGKGGPAGAILCSAGSPTIMNCLVAGNRATATPGGTIYCTNSHAALINCTIVDNFVGQGGAALYLLDSHVEMLNSILWGNGAQQIVSTGVGAALVSYSDVEGGWDGPGCIDAHPLFVDTGYWASPDNPAAVVSPWRADAIWIAGDYHLQSQWGRWDPKRDDWVQDGLVSPCIDRGDPNAPVGQERMPNGGRINLGAYGGTSQASMSPGDG